MTTPANPAAVASSRLTPGAVSRLLGRNQGPEFFTSLTWVPLQLAQINKNVNLNRPLERFTIRWDGRITIAVANYTAVFPESLQNLIQQIKISGTHTTFGSVTPIQLTGADVFAWPALFKTRGCSIWINGVRVNPLGVPNGLPLATFGNIGTYDITVYWDLPLVPVLPVAAKLNAVPFLFQSQDWADTLQIQLAFADATALGTPGTATTVFSAFGSGAGTPTVSIYTNYEILGALADKITTAVTVRSIQQVPQGNITGAVSNMIKLAQLQKYKTLNVVLKSGLLATATSAGVSVFSSLSDAIFEQTQIRVDNKPVRNNSSNTTYKEYLAYAFDAISQPQGYLPMTFIDSLNPRTAFDGDKVSGGSAFEVDSQVLVGNAQNFAEVIQEYFQGTPSGMH